MKKAIIVGASSGIGKELAVILSKNNYSIGLVGRRVNLLNDIQNSINTKSFVKYMDISKPIEAMDKLNELIIEMDGVDLIVIAAGVGYINPDLNYDMENETIDVNVKGFTAIVNEALKFFMKNGTGHLVGISSVAAITGNDVAPAYNASKAYVSNYLNGIRKKVGKSGLNITITEIQPGFVDTVMAKGNGIFWMSSPVVASSQIFKAIKNRKNHAYVTRRWRIIAWLLKLLG